jgi:hypothetical protein
MQDDTIDIHSHIRSARRPDAETGRLLGELVHRCWLGATADRTHPAARGWLRQYGVGYLTYAPACSCEYGRCTTCN